MDFKLKQTEEVKILESEDIKKHATSSTQGGLFFFILSNYWRLGFPSYLNYQFISHL